MTIKEIKEVQVMVRAIGWLEVFTLSFSLWHEKIIDMATKTDAINAL